MADKQSEAASEELEAPSALSWNEPFNEMSDFKAGVPSETESIETRTGYVEMKQEEHKPLSTTSAWHHRIVSVPTGCILLDYDYSEISQANCSYEAHVVVSEQSFGLPGGVKGEAKLKSRPNTDKYKGWLKANVTIRWRLVIIN